MRKGQFLRCEVKRPSSLVLGGLVVDEEDESPFEDEVLVFSF